VHILVIDNGLHIIKDKLAIKTDEKTDNRSSEDNDRSNWIRWLLAAGMNHH